MQWEKSMPLLNSAQQKKIAFNYSERYRDVPGIIFSLHHVREQTVFQQKTELKGRLNTVSCLVSPITDIWGGRGGTTYTSHLVGFKILF